MYSLFLLEILFLCLLTIYLLVHKYWILGAAPSGLTQQDEESSSIANLKSLTKVCQSILLYKVLNVFWSVPKDLANRWTKILLLYSEASYSSWEGFKLFLGRESSSPSPPKKYFFTLLKLKFKWDKVDFPPSYLKCP